MQRYDTFTFKAVKTKEGFIIDKPIIGRIGLLKYYNADGTERIEYRPPEEAFNVDSLNSIKGKPITLGHIAMINADNAGRTPIIGTVLSSGEQDGDNIRADVSIFSLSTKARELSCGYSLDLDETPGTTPDGHHYDAIQRNIKYNHLAVVEHGRAGNARLNMDGDQLIENIEKEGIKNMAKIRLDNGIEYDCAPEVKIEMEKLQSGKQQAKANLDALQGKIDVLEAKNKKIEQELETVKKEQSQNFDVAVKERVEMLTLAKSYKLDKADELTNKDIKIAIIKAVNGDNLELDDKSDEYINAAFDLSKEVNKKHIDNAEKIRHDINTPNQKNKDTENMDAGYDYMAILEKIKQEEATAYLGGK